MKIAVIGLGKMGFNLARNISMKFDVAAFDIDAQRVNDLKKYNIYATTDLAVLIDKLPEQKIVWLMVPAGNVVDSILSELKSLLKEGDIIIDGGNSFYKDSIRRGMDLAESGIGYLDCGTSGGQDAALTGVCTMVGGKASDYETCKDLFEHISVDGGHVFTGESGSGHFVKMVHNGIEY
ncbi:MAG: NAD(P)-binding domain-containing protein, partial [Cyclobacteriaceae bacterium]|nr:NAD(P)-binding domain-containing protein [Cyclobacteriaceae bacterium]